MKLCQIAGAAALAAAALVGCASDPSPMASNEIVTVLDAQELPASSTDAGVAHLGALDKIKIEVFGVPELMREAQVDAAGGISFPFVGAINVDGLTPVEVSRLIEDRLRDGYLKNPVVSVNLVDTVSQTIAVEGEVETPGIYPASGRLTLLRALALAGGPTAYALTEEVVIFREVEGVRYAGVYNLNALRRGLVADPRVYSQDLIVLGDSPRRRAIDRVIAAAPAFTSPLILLLTRL